MTNIYQRLSEVARQSSEISSSEPSEPLSTKPAKSKAVSAKVKSAAHPLEKKVAGVTGISTEEASKTSDEISNKFLESINEIQNKIRSHTLESEEEEEMKDKTLDCLTTLETYITSQIRQKSGKLDDLKFNDDMKAILEKKNPYDIVSVLKKMDRKIAKDKKTDAKLS